MSEAAGEQLLCVLFMRTFSSRGRALGSLHAHSFKDYGLGFFEMQSLKLEDHFEL